MNKAGSMVGNNLFLSKSGKRKPAVNLFPILLVLLMAVLTLLLAGPARCEVDFNANYWYDKAFEEKDFDLKIKYYHKSLEKESENPDIYNNVGVIYKKKGLYDQAIKYFRKAISISRYQTPEYAYLNMAVVYRIQKKYLEAVQACKKAIQIRPAFPKSYNDLGLTYKELGDFDNALKYFKLAVEMDPGFLEANLNIKNLWKVSAGKSAREIELKQRYDLGLEFIENGRIRNAIDTFEWVWMHKMDRDYLDLRENLKKAKRLLEFDNSFRSAVWPAEAGRWGESVMRFESTLKYAEKRQEQLIRRTIDSLEKIKGELEKTRRLTDFYQQGKKHQQKKQWLQAVSYFTKIITEDPSYLDVDKLNKQVQINYYLEEATKKIRSGKWEEARVLLSSAKTTDRNNPELKELEERLRTGIEHESIDFYLNQVQESIFFKDYESALININEVLKLDDKNPEAVSIKNQIKRIKLAFKKKRNLREADRYLKLLKINPEKFKKTGILVLGIILLYILIFKIIRPGRVWARLSRLRELDGNREIYEDLLAADSNKRELYPALAAIYQELDQMDKLESLCEFCQGKEVDEKGDVSSNAQWSMCMADVYKELGQIEKAKDKYETLYKKYPHMEEVLDRMIFFYQELSEETRGRTAGFRLKELLSAKDKFADRKPGTERNRVAAGKKGAALSMPKASDGGMSEEEARKTLLECFGKEKEGDSSKRISLSPPVSEEEARKMLTNMMGEKAESSAGSGHRVPELPEPVKEKIIEMGTDLTPEESRLSAEELKDIEEENKRILKDFLGRK